MADLSSVESVSPKAMAGKSGSRCIGLKVVSFYKSVSAFSNLYA